MRVVLKVLFKIALLPVWIMLAAVQTIATIVVSLGNTVFFVLSGLCFATAAASIAVLGETLAQQKFILIGGCMFGLLPYLAIGAVAALMIVKMIIGGLIFEG